MSVAWPAPGGARAPPTHPKDEQLTTVSAVIPTFNRAGPIVEAIASALGQTAPPEEVIVIDDGSTDDTQARLLPFGGHIRVIRQPNRGPAAARNVGARMATAEWIAWLDSDDLWHPRKLEVQRALAAEVDRKVACLHTRHFILGGDFQTVSQIPPHGGEVTLSDLVHQNRIGLSTAMVRRRTLLDLNGFDETLIGPEDWDLWLRIAAGGGRFAYQTRVLAKYRLSPGSLIHDLEQREKSGSRVLAKLFGQPDLPAEVRKSRGGAFALLYLRLARQSTAAGDRRRTWEYALRAGSHRPGSFFTRQGIAVLAGLAISRGMYRTWRRARHSSERESSALRRSPDWF